MNVEELPLADQPLADQPLADQPLADQLQAIFREYPDTRGYELSVLELPHAIVIQGKVKSFFHKQMAQVEAAKFIKGQELRLMLRNEIIVE